ncbi:MAG TPA: glycosyltransferase [Solirubrobacteraceae bacterium]|nr:glycosyltransferase [Solirubrobacteraceae bacterium]
MESRPSTYADPPLPASIAVGAGTALLVRGRSRVALRGGVLRAGNGPPHPLDATRLPPGDAFWGVVPLHGRGRATVWLEARGGVREALGELELVDGVRAPASTPRRGSVAIAMATYDPPGELFAAQVASLRAQTHADWGCVILDDSSPAAVEGVEGAVAGDPRFSVHPLDVRLGPYGAFERALALVPPEAEFVALCDQDDRWDPDKLAVLVAALRARPDAMLAYCDQRIVEADGTVRSPTYWTDRDGRPGSLARLLVANTVSGSASLFRRELLDLVLPFPQPVGPDAHHDHWIALVARARGEVVFVERALQDYVQHERNVVGHAPRALARSGAPWQERWRRSYEELLLPRRHLAEALIARCDARGLRGYARGDRGALGLARRLAAALAGRTRRARTLGHEERMLRGALWRRYARVRGARKAKP